MKTGLTIRSKPQPQSKSHPERPTLTNPFQPSDKGPREPIVPQAIHGPVVAPEEQSADEGSSHSAADLPALEDRLTKPTKLRVKIDPNLPDTPKTSLRRLSPARTRPTFSRMNTSFSTSLVRPSGSVKGPRPAKKASSRPTSVHSLDTDERPRLARPACPQNSLPREVFERRYENPFRPRSRSVTPSSKPEQAIAASESTLLGRVTPPDSSTPRNNSLRTILSSFRLPFLSPARKSRVDSDDGAPPSSSSSTSRRSSTSSARTDASACSLPSSTPSKAPEVHAPDRTRNGVPRTDPYMPPYNARFPGSVKSQDRRSRRSSVTSSVGPIGNPGLVDDGVVPAPKAQGAENAEKPLPEIVISAREDGCGTTSTQAHQTDVAVCGSESS